MKSYIKPLSIKLITVLLLVIVVAIIHSCRKDTRQSSTPSTALGSSISVDIAELKKIYAISVTNNGFLKLNSGGGSLNLIHTLDVNWNTYTLQKRRDSSIVAEFDMNNDTGLFILKPIKLGDTIKYINKTTATFIQYKNGSRFNFFTKIIEDMTAPGSHSVIQNLHYNEVPLGFSGLILYYTFGLNFINGYHYTNGVIDKTISSLPTINTGSQSINSLQTNVEATCEAYPIYQISCETVTTPTGTYDHGCTSTIIGYDVECDGGDTPGAGGGVSGDGGSGSGAPTPCTPSSSNTVATSSVSNGRLIINVTTGGSGGSSGGSTPPPCPPNTAIPDPCAQANALASNQSFTSKMSYLQTLKNTPGETSDVMEPDGTFKEQVDPANGGTDQNFSTSYFSGSVGFLHNHGNGPGIISVFTANDISTLYTVVTQSNVLTPSTYTYGLVNQYGQSYLLAISNMNNFNTWASTYTSGGAPNDIFLSLYNNLISSSNTATVNEDNLAVLLNKTNSGLTLMKGNAANNAWSQVVLNGGTVSIVQCP